MKHLLFFLAAGLLLPVSIKAQEKNDVHIPIDDTISIRSHFLRADWQVLSRTYFMSTVNQGELKDDYTLATGAGLGVITESFHGFQLGMNGFFIFELASSDLAAPDPVSGNPNRYEAGQYDITRPGDYSNLERLEELYLKYNYRSGYLMAGRFNINTPFVNPQDGRMRPTLEEGVWLSARASKKVHVNGGWLHAVSPRSTMEFYRMQNSAGIYPQGVNEQGTKSDYAGNISSHGLAMVNVVFQPAGQFKVSLWDAFFENVMNTALLELSHTRKAARGQDREVYHALLFAHQDAVGDGGNPDPGKSYMKPGNMSNAISLRVGTRNARWNLQVNYTHITGDGRYLMPREWGRDPFYTFLPRERNEGAGKVNAIMLKGEWKSAAKPFSTGLAWGYYDLPDVKDYRLNKYGMPAYHQLNHETSWKPKGVLSGFELKTLISWKTGSGETYGDPKYVYNKTEMVNFNVILEFKL